MTSGPVSETPGGAPSRGGPAGPPARSRRGPWIALVGAAVVLGIAGGVYATRPKPQPAFPFPMGADAWTVTRQHTFRRHCLEEASRPIPDGVAKDEAAVDRYCSCLTQALAAELPSFSRAKKAFAEGEAATGADGQKAAEVVRRCVESSR